MMRERAESLRDTLHNKARDFFDLCDPEGKGYATKGDLDALRNELPLAPEQLDMVFDALDANADGKLTLEEFTDGFGMFLGIDTLPGTYVDNEIIDENDDEEELEELLEHLGARNLFTDEEYVRQMWKRIRKEDPVMRSNFENFIAKMAADLKESEHERNNLQTTLKNRRQEHENQVQSLYMEMEEQLRLEKEKILDQEQKKEQRLRDELENELQVKDLQLKELLDKHEELESQLAELNSVDAEKKYENIKLQKDRDSLEYQLSSSEKMLYEMKSHLELLRKRSLDEKRKRAQVAFKVSEGIALERENLVLELHHLKEINKQLQDEKDELEQTTVQMLPVSLNSVSKNSKNETQKAETSERNSSTKSNNCSLIENGTAKLEKLQNGNIARINSLERKAVGNHPLNKVDSRTNTEIDNSLPEDGDRLSFFREDTCGRMDEIQNNLNIPPGGRKQDRPQSPTRCKSSSPNTPRKSPLQRKITKRKSILEDAAPTRVFKVVFVGDSGVGKTSILQRFCTDSFKSTFSATIGVDFQVKTVEVDGERIALQLWDTAGQERFRSMTHQYFRKADGIIVVYDVTSETSFRNVRNWMHNIQEGAQDGIIVMLMGNKVDLCESENDRVVRTKDGVHLADECGTLFFETSAKTGDSICDAIEALASFLKTKEDEAMEHVLKLQEEEMDKRNKKCC